MARKKKFSQRKSKKFKDKNKSHHSKHGAKSGSNVISKEVVGVFSGTRHGYGFVAVEKQPDDIFIPFRNVNGALSGDQVRVKISKARRVKPGKDASNRQGPSGDVIQIIERKNEQIVGVLAKNERDEWIVQARLEGFPDVRLEGKADLKIQTGELVLVRIKRFPTERNPFPIGEIHAYLGKSGDPLAEEKAVIIKHRIREEHPAAAVREAEAFPKTIQDVQGRKDLRQKLFFTIDGARARDFDDAVCLEEDQGRYRLYVAIADVAHYVTPGSALDQEAYKRSTSVYFPTRAIHMLPAALSAGLCSLVPNQDRYALVAEMLFDRNGGKLEADFYEAIFHSQARLTYDEVDPVLQNGKFLAGEPKVSPITDSQRKSKIEHALGEMGQLQKKIFVTRKARGSLEFDLPEAEFVFAEEGGEHAIENIIKGTRLQSHHLVEEFMIVANEAVAEFLTDHDVPMPYRIHEPPDPVKIQDFLRMIEKLPEVRESQTKLDSKEKKQAWEKPGFIAGVLEKIKDLPQARLLNQLLLTSLKLAIYSPHNKGHFGLASECYGHFTSPIRRYPDLMLHRILKAYVARKFTHAQVQKLAEQCEHCSAQEQIAVAAEREIIQFYKVRFMKERLGQVFPGRIVKVTAFGFFVELETFFIDGFVPLETLEDDDYSFQKDRQAIVSKRRTFLQGDLLQICVAAVDIDRRRITFTVED